MQSIGWICYNSVDTVILPAFQPVKTVGMHQHCSTKMKSGQPLFVSSKFTLNARDVFGMARAKTVNTTFFPYKNSRCIESQVGPDRGLRRRPGYFLYPSLNFLY